MRAEDTAGFASLPFSPTVSGRVDGAILLVTIDNPPVNATSASVRAGLVAAVDHAAGTESITAIVLTGAGSSFIGGADIREFGQPAAEPTLPAVMAALEHSAKPVIAALNGAALGGGLEVALACHHRIALGVAKIGLPEVKLGIVPGAGGTQRLPRLTGIAAAIDLIATGRVIGAAEALPLGLVDQVVDDGLIAAALAAAAAQVGQPIRRTGTLPVPDEDGAIIDAASAKALARAKGQTAPREAVRLVLMAGEARFVEGLAEERATFLTLRDSDEAKALRHVFFAERASAKVDGLDGVAPRPLGTIGVVGLGLMGAGIAVALLDAGFSVIGVDTSEAAVAGGGDRIAGLFDRSVASGRMTAVGKAERLARLTLAPALDALAPVDLVIEAVFDDFDVKSALFRQLDGIVRPDAVLATNTSYLDPDALAAVTIAPERVIGLHFFSPANIMRLMEVVRCARTAPDVLATGLALAKRMGKLPVVAGVCEGFIGNRIFSAYRREAEFLLEDGALPETIDAAMESFGMAMGPFAVFDLAGLEIAWNRRKRQAATRDPAARYVAIADRLCEAGRFGQKSGRGWYRYDTGKRAVDPEVTAVVEACRAAKGLIPRAVAADEIVARLTRAMAVEGTALLTEGIAARASDIDLVMIHGYGFPAALGGPMFMAEARTAS